MLTTDVTKVSLPEIKDYFAKPLLVEMRTSIISTKLEMGLSVVGDTPLYGVPIATCKALISLECLAVNTDLPTNAAAMLALVSDTFKAFVIFRCI